jgi:hypothetical protein
VGHEHIEITQDGPPSKEFDAYGVGFVDLMSVHDEEGYTSVGSLFLLPQIYFLLEMFSWHSVDVGDEEVICS